MAALCCACVFAMAKMRGRYSHYVREQPNATKYDDAGADGLHRISSVRYFGRLGQSPEASEGVLDGW